MMVHLIIFLFNIQRLVKKMDYPLIKKYVIYRPLFALNVQTTHPAQPSFIKLIIPKNILYVLKYPKYIFYFLVDIISFFYSFILYYNFRIAPKIDLKIIQILLAKSVMR